MSLRFVVWMSALIILQKMVSSDDSEENKEAEGHKGICHCGVFREADDPLKTAPLIERNPNILMTKNEEGEKSCGHLCISLAEAAKKDAPKIICEAVKDDVKDLKVTIYSHLCGENWVSTGKTSTVPICCHGGFPIDCNTETSFEINPSESKPRENE